ncbi:MAG TPA: ABC transporter permease, partial [Dehalococcoidia bacterium]|nr:ABC transporter permease [Dehalococcoidia bacterium]
TGFAPKESLSGWLEVAATVNPMTYLFDGMRALTMNGWEAGEIGGAFLAAAGLGVVTLNLAFMALRSRVG